MTICLMEWDDKLSEAKEASTDKVARAKDQASSKIEGTVDSVSDTIPDREDAKDLADKTKRGAVLEYRYAKTGFRHPISRQKVLVKRMRDDPLRTIKGVLLLDTQAREELIEETVGVSEREAHLWATISYQQFANKGPQVKQPAIYYTKEALELSREIDFGQTFRFGKYGAKAGAKYGDYVPIIGDLGPYIGFAVGAATGVADGINVIDAGIIEENTGPASDAADEIIQTEEDQFRTRIFRGGAAFAESRFGHPTEPTLNELVKMDYRDFAN